MLNKLQIELDQLKKKQQKTQSCINNLFFSVEDIYIRQYSINHPILPNSNLIIKVRPEIIDQILAFLDYSTFLQFRLVCQNTNNQILYLLSLKLSKKQQQQQMKQIELNEIIENHTELGELQDSLLLQFQKSLEDIKKIKRQDICEVNSFCRPPYAIERVLYFLTVLLTENYVEQQNQWKQSLRVINDCQFFNQLLNFDLISITEDKLNLLKDIITMEEKYVYSSSLFAYYIYKYIRTAVILRQQPEYKTIFQVAQIRQDILKLQTQIEKLQKLLC